MGTAQDLNTKTFHSIVKFLFYCRRNVYQVFSVSFVSLRYFMLQSATFTPFSVPVPDISHFVVLGLSPETKENLWKIFTVSKTEILSFEKKVLSSA